MSLRNEWVREIAIGNEFSRLYVTVDEKKPKEVVLVRPPRRRFLPCVVQLSLKLCRTPALAAPFRMPRHPPCPAPEADKKPSRHAQIRRKTRQEVAFSASLRGASTWNKSQVLAQKKKHYKQKLATLLPSTWEELETMQLRGVGYEQGLSELAQREICLSVLEDHLLKNDPEAYERVQAARRKRIEAEIAAMEAAAAEAKAREPKPGPNVVVSTDRLWFQCDAGASASSSLLVTNTGTTVLHYRWRVERETGAGPHSK